MFVLDTPTQIFYSAGKIATQALRTIPDSKQLFPKPTTNLLRPAALRNIKQKLISDPRSITVLIREPRDRFMSGLFELIAKHIYSPFIEFQISSKVDSEVLSKQIDVFYNSKWWDMAFDRCLRLAPHSWINNVELDSSRWQYHVGNWLEDVIELEKIAISLDKSINIVDIINLDSYLNSLGFTFRKRNRRRHFLFALNDKYTELYTSIDHRAIEIAFNEAYSRIAIDLHSKFENYIETEVIIYNTILSTSTMMYKP